MPGVQLIGQAKELLTAKDGTALKCRSPGSIAFLNGPQHSDGLSIRQGNAARCLQAL